MKVASITVSAFHCQGVGIGSPVKLELEDGNVHKMEVTGISAAEVNGDDVTPYLKLDLAEIEEKVPIKSLAVQYPAQYIAHWPSGPVPCCEYHKDQIVLLGGVMGCHVAVTENNDHSLECTNCRNEEDEEEEG